MTDFAVVDLHYGRHIPDPYQAFGILSALLAIQADRPSFVACVISKSIHW
jgi:hypothetical protein